MSLRLRLIAAFFVLSVVPLAAVTFMTYANNVKAVQAAASREANLLAGELTERMQMVTAQLSERIEHLMSMPQMVNASTTSPVASPPRPAAPRPATPAAPAAPAPATGEDVVRPGTAPTMTTLTNSEVLTGQVAAALGEAAMLLNNVELRGLPMPRPGDVSRQGRGSQYRFSGDAAGARGGPPGGGRWSDGAPGGRGDRDRSGRGSGTGGARSMGSNASGTASTAAAGAVPPVPAPPPPMTPAPPRRDDPATPRPSLAQPPPAAGANAPPNPSAPPSPSRAPTVTVTGPGDAVTRVGPDARDRILIDLAPIRRDLMRQALPDGQRLDQLSAEERQRLNREISQRMMGIMQGIQLGAVELQKRASEAKRDALLNDEKAAATAAKAESAARRAPSAAPAAPTPSARVDAGTTPTPTPAAAPVAGTPSPSPAAAPNAASTPATPKPKTKTELSGSHLGVMVEHDGQMVQQVSAELNLPNVLATVFSTTRRDRGEVPFAIGKDGNLFAPSDDDRQRIAGLGDALAPSGPPTRTSMSGDWLVVTTADPTGSGMRFGIARPVGGSMSDLRRTAARNASIGLLFICAAIVVIVPLSSGLTRNLTTLTDAVSRIAHGDFRARVPIASRDEIGRLAMAFNRMAEDVERHQHAAVEQERIRRELELGRQIQHEMLPHAPFRLGLTEINGVSVPAREVGGDFFNYFEVDGGRIAILVGDVSGKGVGAEQLMANIQASLRTRLALGQNLSAVADAIDRDIGANTPGPVYATLFVGIIDPVTRTLHFVNAGHHPQYVLQRRGGLERMASTGLPVGLVAGRGYTEGVAQLEEGDMLFLYTDGCVEAENDSEDMFGAERLEALLASAPSSGPDEVLRRVEAAVKSFRGTREPFDDETMMAVRIG
jgi:serine phosphatase RsbU (regulator of sigma subunit)